MSQFDPELEEGIKSDTDEEVTEPPLYKVLLLNDDYTTMEFVVEVLRYVFHKTIEGWACAGYILMKLRKPR